MGGRELLLANMDKIHTTRMGAERIKRNLNLDREDAVAFCRNVIADRDCQIDRKGKNWYCQLGNIRITVNAYSYTVITAHIVK